MSSGTDTSPVNFKPGFTTDNSGNDVEIGISASASAESFLTLIDEPPNKIALQRSFSLRKPVPILVAESESLTADPTLADANSAPTLETLPPLQVPGSGTPAYASLHKNPDVKIVPEPSTVDAIPWTTVIQDPVGKRIDIVPGDAVIVEQENGTTTIISPVDSVESNISEKIDTDLIVPVASQPVEKGLQISLSEQTLESLDSVMEAFHGPADDTVFGFGGFQTVFITEEELEASRRKLGEEGEITQEIRIERMIENLINSTNVSTPVTNDEHNTHETTELACVLCCQWTQLGTGTMKLNENLSQLQWIGASVTSENSFNKELVLTFDLKDCSDIHIKALQSNPDNTNMDTSSALLVTYKDATFLQFLVQGHQESLSQVAASIRSLMKLPQVDTTTEREFVNNLTISENKSLSLRDPTKDPGYMNFKAQAELELNQEISRIRQEMEERIEKAQAMFQSKLESYLEARQLQDDRNMSEGAAEFNFTPQECQICFNAMTSMVLKPCHHTLCESCCEQIKTHCDGKCPFDRVLVTEMVSMDPVSVQESIIDRE